MTIFQAFTSGLKNIPKRLVVWLYIITLCFALFAVWPLRSLLFQAVGNSLMGEKILREFSWNFFMDGFTKYRIGFWTWWNSILTFLFIYSGLSAFLTGGILVSVLPSKPEFSFRKFFFGCGKYFLRFLGIAIFAFVIYTVLIAGSVMINSGIHSAMIDRPTETLADWLGRTFYLLALLAGILFTVISDYARIAIVSKDIGIFKALGEGFKLAFSCFIKTYFLSLLLFITGLVLFGIYWFVEGKVDNTSVTLILLLFTIQQLYIFSRLWLKSWYGSSQFLIYEEIGGAVLPAEESHPKLSSEPGM
jgi:hypothetical protein